MSAEALSRVLVRTKALLEVEAKRGGESQMNVEGVLAHFMHICGEEGVSFATRNALQDQSNQPTKSNLEVVQGQNPAGSP